MTEPQTTTEHSMTTDKVAELLERSSLGGKNAQRVRSDVDAVRVRMVLDRYRTAPEDQEATTASEVEPVGDQEVPGAEPPRTEDRTAVDVALVQAFKLDDFSSASYQRFRVELVRYGLAVLDAWVRSGRIFDQVQRLSGIDVAPTYTERLVLFRDHDERLDLVTDVIVRAHQQFHQRAMIEGQWTTAHGNLRTYFIGGAVFNFPNAFRRWRHMQARLHTNPVGDRSTLPTSSLNQDPADIVERRSTVESLLQALTPRERAIVTLVSDGHSMSTIAELLGIRRNAMEPTMGRIRRKAARIDDTR